MANFPLHPKNPGRICWGCDKLCPADDMWCGNGTIRSPHPCELMGDDWYESLAAMMPAVEQPNQVPLIKADHWKQLVYFRAVLCIRRAKPLEQKLIYHVYHQLEHCVCHQRCNHQEPGSDQQRNPGYDEHNPGGVQRMAAKSEDSRRDQLPAGVEHASRKPWPTAIA
jgi:Protein of unknown function (DUF3079)